MGAGVWNASLFIYHNVLGIFRGQHWSFNSTTLVCVLARVELATLCKTVQEIIDKLVISNS